MSIFLPISSVESDSFQQHINHEAAVNDVMTPAVRQARLLLSDQHGTNVSATSAGTNPLVSKMPEK